MASHATHPLADVLRQFEGKTADQIADIVRKHRIRGRSGTTSKCPMALLLGGQATGSFVIGRRYLVRRSGKWIEKARTPVNIASFVRKFDIGKYPDLMAPAPRCMFGKTSKKASGKSGQHIQPRKPRKPRKIVNHLAKLVDRFGPA